MKISKIALSLALALCTVSLAQAQLGVYGTVTVKRMTDIPYTQGNTSYTNGSFDPVGATGGIYYNFKTVGPVRLGIDARGGVTSSKQGAYTAYNANGGKLDFGLAGVRASFHTPFVPLKPYVEGLAGIARTNFGTEFDNFSGQSSTNPANLTLTTHLEYDVHAGLDVTILPLVDFRVVELGYGAVQGNGHTYPVQSLSTGIVIRLPFGLPK